MSGSTTAVTDTASPAVAKLGEVAGAEGLELIKAALRVASVGSSELDVAIEAWLYRSGRNWYGTYDVVPNLTTSEDAAKELSRRTFPGAMWRIYDDEGGGVCAQIIAEDMGYHKQKAATWPLAIVLAALEGVGA